MMGRRKRPIAIVSAALFTEVSREALHWSVVVLELDVPRFSFWNLPGNHLPVVFFVVRMI